MIKIELCLGSSCYSRGNQEVLTLLENYIEKNGLQDWIGIQGHLCMNNCLEGPHVRIGSVDFPFSKPEEIITCLEKRLTEEQ